MNTDSLNNKGDAQDTQADHGQDSVWAAQHVNKPDPMAEDIDELFVKYGYPKLTQSELKLKPALVAYTTNKIIEARVESLDDAYGYWHMHGGRKTGQFIKERIAELKVLNHRKDEDG